MDDASGTLAEMWALASERRSGIESRVGYTSWAGARGHMDAGEPVCAGRAILHCREPQLVCAAHLNGAHVGARGDHRCVRVQRGHARGLHRADTANRRNILGEGPMAYCVARHAPD